MIVDGWKDGTCAPRSTTRRLRGDGSDGSSFSMLMMFERFAGAIFAGSTAACTGVELGRAGSLGMVKRLGKRVSVGEQAGDCPYDTVWL